MSSFLTRHAVLATVGLAAVPFAGRLAAQTPITGNLSGTLTAGVYVATGTIAVQAGQTLTLNPGVIVKFQSSGCEFTVNGTLLSNGTAANPVIFTGYADDSAGGDTNNNGPSSAGPTAWRGVVFNSATANASVLNYTDIRYGGSGFVSNVHCNSANPTLSHCTIRNNYTHGVNLSGNSFPVVHDCTFTGNYGNAIEGVSLMGLPNLLNNTASGNGVNIARVTVGSVTGNLTIAPASMLGGAITIDTAVGVPAGASLTFAPGVICKWLNGGDELTVDGTLQVNGTAANPVIFTGFADDSAGGDTNTNGASSAGPTAWRGIVFNTATSNASVLNYADIRYGGNGYVSNVHCNAASPTLSHCILRNNYTHGMNLSSNSFPVVHDCTFTGSYGNAIEGVSLMGLPTLLNNTATGNGANIARVTVGTVSGNLTIPAAAMLGGAITIDTGVSVPAGASLTFAPGVICKWLNGGDELTVGGTLVVNGTAANPVIFTGYADDSAGGDTNNNGPSSAGPTAWRGIVFTPGSTACTLDYADIRYGGNGYVSNVHCNQASPTLSHCTIRNNYTHGMNLSGNSTPIVHDCTFTGNSGNAVEGLPFTGVPNFSNNTASGNGGNFMRVVTGDVAGALHIGSHSAMQGALVMAATIHVLPAGDLVVDQGVNFKFEGAYEVVVEGAAHFYGTGYEPIVFTSMSDDSIAGDTNNNGPSSGGAAQWRGVTFQSNALSSLVRNVRVRYTGSGFVPGLTSLSPRVVLRSVAVDHSYDRGFVLQALANSPTNLIAWANGGHGIHLVADSFLVVHATCYGNGTGIRREAAWSGSVVNSISYGNGTNFANFTAAQVQYSDGAFPGQNGNLNVDPQFVAAAAGDLHLNPTSPCLDVADASQALLTKSDHDENSRLLDHSLNGYPGPDMGAYELPAWDMAVAGAPRPGSTMTFTINGPAGESFIALGLVDGSAPFFPWGMLLVGQPGTSVALLYPLTIPTGFPIPLPLVNDPSLIGIGAGIQTLTFPAGNYGLGNFTRLYRLLIRP